MSDEKAKPKSGQEEQEPKQEEGVQPGSDDDGSEPGLPKDLQAKEATGEDGEEQLGDGSEGAEAGQEIVEPPEPGKLTDQELAQHPSEYLEEVDGAGDETSDNEVDGQLDHETDQDNSDLEPKEGEGDVSDSERSTDDDGIPSDNADRDGSDVNGEESDSKNEPREEGSVDSKSDKDGQQDSEKLTPEEEEQAKRKMMAVETRLGRYKSDPRGLKEYIEDLFDAHQEQELTPDLIKSKLRELEADVASVEKGYPEIRARYNKVKSYIGA